MSDNAVSDNRGAPAGAFYLVAVTESKTATTSLEQHALGLEELTALFTTYEVGEKDGVAVIPATFAPCPTRCPKEGMPKARSCGGGQMHRLDANVSAMTMLGLDVDHASESQMRAMLDGLREGGYRFWSWQTYSHAGGDDCRFRVLVPLACPLVVSHPRQWSQIAWPALVKVLGVDERLPDRACRNPSHVFYLPRKANEADAREAEYHDGLDLDWRPVLGDSLQKMARGVAEVREVEPEDPTRAVDLGDVRERLGRVRKPGTKEMLANVRRGKAPVPPPAKRNPGQPSRWQAWRTVTWELAYAAHEWESTEALLEVIRPAWQAEVADCPDDHTPWEKVVGLFESTRAGVPAHKAQKEAEKQARIENNRRAYLAGYAVLHGKRDENKDEEGEDEGENKDENKDEEGEDEGPGIGPMHTGDLRLPDDEQWRERLEFNDKGEPKKVAHNAKLVFSSHAAWRGVFRYNEVTQSVEMHSGPLYPGEVRRMRSSDAGRLADWLAREEKIQVGDNLVWDRALAIAEDGAYNPVQDYLRSIASQGEGVDFAERFLSEYCGAEDNAYTRAVSRCWLVALAARAMRPGCKMDNVLILESAEGMFKSSALKALADPWCSVLRINLRDKDAMMVAAQTWLVELGELTSMQRSEIEFLKAFFADQEDRFRPPYGRVLESFPRRCVFVGTTNRGDYLADTTGNRRYWPVTLVHPIDIERVRTDRARILATGLRLFSEGAQWWLTSEEQQRAIAETDARAPADTLSEEIVHFVLSKPKERRPREVSTRDVCVDILREPASRALETRIGFAMRRLGWEKTRVSRGTLRPWVWLVPEELLNAPGGGAPGILAPVLPIHRESGTSK